VRQRPPTTSREPSPTWTSSTFSRSFARGTRNIDGASPTLRTRQAEADYPGPWPQVRAFPTYPADPPFPNVESIYESHHNEYLEQLKVEQHDGLGSNAERSRPAVLKQQNTFVKRGIRHRLNLCFRAPIADLMYPGAEASNHHPDELALFFRSDKPDELADPSSKETKKWLAKKSKSLDYRKTPAEVKKGLQIFATRILVNTEDETAGQGRGGKAGDFQPHVEITSFHTVSTKVTTGATSPSGPGASSCFIRFKHRRVISIRPWT